MRSHLRGLLILFVLGTLPVPLHAQKQEQQPESPVFRRRFTPQAPLLHTPDALYEIWQAFLVSRKANAGDPVAQQELGVRYMLGRGIEADTVKAAYWFYRAAEQNMLSSRFNLGILLYHGWGLSWNPFESFRAFLICAEAGMHEAQYVVGLHYTENLVVTRDYGAALSWIRRAADGGYTPAREAIPELERLAALQHADSAAADTSVSPLAMFMDAGDDSSASAATRALVNNVLLGGDPELRKALGLSRMLDASIAIDSLRLQGIEAAAAAGSPEALAILGRNFETGRGVGRDVVQACSHYIRALRMDWPRASALLTRLVQEPGVIGQIRARARRDDPEAQFVWVALLGLGYEGLLFREQSILTPAQALGMLRKGADRGHLPSINELALCHYAGRWTDPNTGEARRLWSRSAGAGSREGMVRLAVVTVREEEDTTALRDAVVVLRQAAEDGSILAEMALAFCHERGIGVTPGPSEAVRHYRNAARRGSQDAYRALRRMHDALRPDDKAFRVEEI